MRYPVICYRDTFVEGCLVLSEFGSGVSEQLPATNAGGLYKVNSHQEGWSCRGLSVPCFQGRRGHGLFLKLALTSNDKRPKSR